MDETDAAIIQQLPIGIVLIDDDEALLLIFEVTLDQRQRSLADRSEADHCDRTVDAPVPRPMGHEISFRDERLLGLKATAFSAMSIARDARFLSQNCRMKGA